MRLQQISIEADSIEVSISWSGREFLDARIRDLSARGPTIFLSVSAEMPELPAGSIISATIHVPGLDPVNNVLSIVRQQRFAGSECLLDIEIVDWTPVRKTMPSELFALFSQRRYVRVDTQELPIRVMVRWNAKKPPGSARLENISASGCAILFAHGAAPDVEDVILEFQLPDSEHLYHLTAKIKNVTEVGGLTSCGMEFHDDHSHEFLSQQSRISHFVEVTQREQLIEISSRVQTLTN